MTTQKFKHFLVFSMVALVFVGFIVLLSFMHYRAQATDSTVTVGLKLAHNAQFAGMYVADINEIYQREDLIVKFREPTTNQSATPESVVNGVNDFAIVSPIQLIDAVSKGLPVKAIAAIYQKSPSAIVSLKESGINKPKDLKNKTIGTTQQGDYSSILYAELLNKNRIPLNSIGTKATEYEPISDLIYKKVDAVAMHRTNAYLPKNSPNVELSFIYPEEYGIIAYDDIIIASTETIDKNPEMVTKFVEATVKGWEQALEYPDEAIEATLKYAHDEYSNEEYEKHILEVNEPLIRPDNGKSIGNMTGDRWQEVYQIYKASRIAPDFDIAKAFTLDFLP